MKKYKEYLLYMFIILLLSIVYIKIHQHFERDFRMGSVQYYHYLVPYTLQLLLGIAVGLEKIIEEFRKKGGWGVDMSRLLIMGLPTLILSFPIFPIPRILMILPFPTLFIYSTFISSRIIIFIRIFLGYVIITSFSKKSETHIQ